MNSLLLALLAVVVALDSTQVGSNLLAPSANHDERDSKEPAFEGRIIDAAVGSPIRGALIRFQESTSRQEWAALSNAQGRWRIGGLNAGVYQVSAAKAGYVTANHGQQGAWNPGLPVKVGRAGVGSLPDLLLARAGAIEGTLIDEGGEPVMDANVTAMRHTYLQGNYRLLPLGRVATTNDLGAFRLFGLPPGKYFVVASWGSGASASRDNADVKGFAPTYYPGSADVAAAQQVIVGTGGDVGPVNISMLGVKTARISGMATGSHGRPLAGGVVALTRRVGDLIPGAFGGKTNADGSFSLSGVPPGDYTLAVSTTDGADSAGESASQRVTVTGYDIDNLSLVSPPSGRVSGIVTTMAPDPAMPAAAATALRVIALPATPEDADRLTLPNGGLATVGADGRFDMPVRPGRWLLRVVGEGAGGWRSVSMRRNAAEIADTGLEIVPRNNVGDLEIVMSQRLSRITGNVSDGERPLPIDTTVVMFSRDRAHWGFASRRVTVVQPDAAGAFSAAGLPPGSYVAVAVHGVERPELRAPATLGSVQADATPFDVAGTETVRVVLTRVVDLSRE